MFSQWSKRYKERVVRTMFSDNGEHPTNQSGIAATCATRGIPSRVCVITGACPGPPTWHFGGGSHLIRDGNHFGLNYQRRPLHATNVCKKGCRRQCKCRSSNLQCTELCKCSGACGGNVQQLNVCCPFLVHSSSHSVSLSLFLVCLYMMYIMTMLLCKLY